jgi:UDP:flavonoid glycosyltransferase YjiC (YdhE family)
MTVDQSSPLILCMPHCDVLGHAGRTLRLATALRQALPGHRIEFAGRGHCTELIKKAGFVCHDVVEFLQEDWKEVEDRARKHRDMVRAPGLVRRFVEEEVELFTALRPLAVIGDHRYTLFTSTQIARVPLIAITNAFFTRYSSLGLGLPKALLPIYQRYPGLAWFHPFLSIPLSPAVPYFVRRIGRLHCVPYNAVRKDFGLEPHRDLFDFYAGDQVLLPDLPDVCPTRNLPETYHYVGMFGWSPEDALPEGIGGERKIIYLTLGSTGRPEEFEKVLSGLLGLEDYKVIVTAGRFVAPDGLGPLPEHIRVFRFLAGERVLERACLAIHHGGMGILGQCLRAGVPMVCVPGNIEQEVMARRFVKAKGLGLVVERYGLSPGKLEKAAREVLRATEYALRVRTYAERIRGMDPVGEAAEKIRGFLQDESFLEAVAKGRWKRS